MRSEHLTPMEAIKLKCLDCCCGNANEVKMCSCEDCSLYIFRLGKNPNIRRRNYTEEERERMRERFAANPSMKRSSKKE